MVACVTAAGFLASGAVDGAGGGADAAWSAAARGMGVDGGHDQSAEAGSMSSCGIQRLEKVFLTSEGRMMESKIDRWKERYKERDRLQETRATLIGR